MRKMAIAESLNGAEKYIHTIRGSLVVLDADLAKLYNLPLAAFNRAVARQATRFPKDFKFKLTREEVNSLNIKSRRVVYAFTEEGIAMLSVILKSPLAVKVSVSLVRSAVEMRHFIVKNSPMLENVAAAELKQIERQKAADEKLAKIINFIEEQTCTARPAQKIFFSGQIYDAYSFLVDLISRAKKSLILVDGYANVQTLDFLRHKREGVEVAILALPSAKLAKVEIKKFNAEYPKLTLYKTADFHDRFLILDEKELYHIGASLKDAGEKSFAITRLEEVPECEKLLKRVRGIMGEKRKRYTGSNTFETKQKDLLYN